MATAAPDRIKHPETIDECIKMKEEEKRTAQEMAKKVDSICETLKALEVSTESTFDVEDLREWMNGELEAAKSWKIVIARYANIMALSHTVKIAQQYHDALKSGKPFNLMEVCLGLTEIVSDAVSGIFGNTSRQLCRIILAIMFTPTLEGANIVSLSLEAVCKEFLKNYQTERFFREVSERLKMDTKTLHHDMIVQKSFLNYLSDLFAVVNGEMLEISNTFYIEKADLSRWTQLFVLYCHACVFEFLLHSAVVAASVAEGDKQESWMKSLEGVKERAKEKLAFLSDRGNLAPNALLPFQPKKILKMQKLSGDSTALNVVETLRYFLRLSKMPGLTEIENALAVAKNYNVRLKYDDYEIPYKKTCNFQFINHSNFPVKIRSGIVGTKKIAELSFFCTVNESSSIVQRIRWLSFSTGGYFIIYLDGELPAGEELVGSTKIIQFSMSFPTFGCRKIAILDKSLNPERRSSSECYDQMYSGDCPPIYFQHSDKYFVVACRIDYYNGYYHWRFILQECDPIQDA